MQKKTERFELLLTKSEKSKLGKLALRESKRLKEQFSRADWLRRQIQQADV